MYRNGTINISFGGVIFQIIHPTLPTPTCLGPVAYGEFFVSGVDIKEVNNITKMTAYFRKLNSSCITN